MGFVEKWDKYDSDRDSARVLEDIFSGINGCEPYHAFMCVSFVLKEVTTTITFIEHSLHSLTHFSHFPILPLHALNRFRCVRTITLLVETFSILGRHTTVFAWCHVVMYVLCVPARYQITPMWLGFVFDISAPIYNEFIFIHPFIHIVVVFVRLRESQAITASPTMFDANIKW